MLPPRRAIIRRLADPVVCLPVFFSRTKARARSRRPDLAQIGSQPRTTRPAIMGRLSPHC